VRALTLLAVCSTKQESRVTGLRGRTREGNLSFMKSLSIFAISTALVFLVRCQGWLSPSRQPACASAEHHAPARCGQGAVGKPAAVEEWRK